jgi:glycosyltransferase involved in cell wall biosynthesis
MAHRRGRPFAVWTDRVESGVTAQATRTPGPWRPRLRAALTHRPMAALERAVIRRASLGLFHGKDTYDAYAPYSRNPQIVHDVLVGADVRIDAASLKAKQDAAGEGPLRIIYAGRVAAMKGPLEWVAALVALRAQSVPFDATWIGDGEALPAMRAAVLAAGLQDRVSLPGFQSDRSAVLDALRGAHVLMFCHKTAESPRVLIEALMTGTPIVGYAGAYPLDLVSAHGGGVMTAPGEPAALAATLAVLAQDRHRLADLIGRAAADGAGFDEVSVFAHRSAVIRKHLGWQEGLQT